MKPTQSKTKTRTKAGRTASLRCEAMVRNLWAPAATAPKGPLILADFGWPWPCMATWCERSQKWAAVSVQRETDDAWFENEYEAPSDLRRWMPWPSLPNKADMASGRE